MTETTPIFYMEHPGVSLVNGFFHVNHHQRLILKGQILFQYKPDSFIKLIDSRRKKQSNYFVEWAFKIWIQIEHVKQIVHKFFIALGKTISPAKLSTISSEVDPMFSLSEAQTMNRYLRLLVRWNTIKGNASGLNELKYEKLYKRVLESEKAKGLYKRYPTIEELMVCTLKLRSHFYGLDPNYFFDAQFLPRMRQSCTPNIQVNIITDEDGKDCQVTLSALCLIYPGESLSYSKINHLYEDVTRRTKEIQQLYGFTCTCDCCQHQLKKSTVDKCEDKFLDVTPTMRLSEELNTLLSGEEKVVTEQGWCFWCGLHFYETFKKSKKTGKIKEGQKVLYCICRKAIYCTQKCQLAHWESNHKYDCCKQ